MRPRPKAARKPPCAAAGTAAWPGSAGASELRGVGLRRDGLRARLDRWRRLEAGESLLQALAQRAVRQQQVARLVATMGQRVAVERDVGAALLQNALGHGKIDQIADCIDTAAVQDVEFGDLEGRRQLVLHHLYARAVAADLVARLDRSDAPDVESHRRVVLERVAAGGGLGRAEHHPDL